MSDDTELDRLMAEHDVIGALAHLVKKSGATVTLHGVPVDGDQLRAAATAAALDRVVDAVLGERTSDEERARRMRALIEEGKNKVSKPTKDPVFKDKSGRVVEEGDLIVYGHALGRCAGLQYGRVLEVVWSGKPEWNYKTKRDEHVPRLRVQGVSHDWTDEAPRLLKPSLLSFGERVLVLAPIQVEQSVYELLQKECP